MPPLRLPFPSLSRGAIQGVQEPGYKSGRRNTTSSLLAARFVKGVRTPPEPMHLHVIDALPRFVDQVRAYPSTRRFTAPTGSPAAPRRRHREVHAWPEAPTGAEFPRHARVPVQPHPAHRPGPPRSPGCPAERIDQAHPGHAMVQPSAWTRCCPARPGRPSSRHGAADQATRFVIPLALWSAPIDFPRATPQDAVDGPLAGWPRGSPHA